MARRRKNKKNQRQKKIHKKPNYHLREDDEHYDSGTSTPEFASTESNGPKIRISFICGQKSKGAQIFDTLNAYSEEKGKPHYYYQQHYRDAIRDCNAYWDDNDYENPVDREVWRQYNKIRAHNKLAEIWEPSRESQIRDTEDFWRGMKRDFVLAASNTPRWKAENEKRAARGLPPIDRDRVRPWCEIPMYLPYDPTLPEYQLPRTFSRNPRYNDRQVRYARTYVLGSRSASSFILTPDVDARPWLNAQYEGAREKSAAGENKGQAANGEDVFQADAPNTSGTRYINSVEGPSKVTDEMVEHFREVAGPVARRFAELYLEANGCDVNLAVNLYLNEQDYSEDERFSSQLREDMMILDERATMMALNGNI